MNSLGITSYKDFMAIEDKDVKRKVLLEEVQSRSAKEIAEEWGCQVYNIYDRMRQAGIPGQRTAQAAGTRAPKKTAGINTPAPKVEKEIKKMPEVNSFTIKLVLTTKGEEITDRLMRMIDILNKDSLYNLTFDIKEIRRSESDAAAPAETTEAIEE